MFYSGCLSWCPNSILSHLNASSMVFLGFRRVINVTFLVFRSTRFLLMSHFMRIYLFLLPQFILIGGDDNLLAYIIRSSNPATILTSLKHPISQFYYRCNGPLVTCSLLSSSSSDTVFHDDLPIALYKDKC